METSKFLCRSTLGICTWHLNSHTWPEKWLFETAQTLALDELADSLIIDKTRLEQYIEEGLQAGKHREFYTLSQLVYQSEKQVRKDVCRFSCRKRPRRFRPLVERIKQLLS